MSAPTRDQLAQARVLVVGDAMLDRYWHGRVDRISAEAPVPVLTVSSEEDRLGGAANVALNVRTLGGDPRLFTVIGEVLQGQGIEVRAAGRIVDPGAGGWRHG